MLTVPAVMKLWGHPNDQSNSRNWLYQFERMRAAGGFRPVTIHVDSLELLRAGELPADAVLLAAANDD